MDEIIEFYRSEGIMRDYNKTHDRKIDISKENCELFEKKGWTLSEIANGKEKYILSPDLQSHCPGIVTYEPIDINLE